MSEARITNLSNESNTGGPTISGITTFSGANYFVPPVGTTAERPENPEKGSMRFNTDTKNLEYFRGDTLGWVELEASYPGDSSPEGAGGYTGFIAGGNDPSPWTPNNTIDYVTITTMGNSADFGDMETAKTGNQTMTNKTRMIFPGGYTGSGYQIHVSYNNVQSKGNGSDFGDLIQVKASASCVANSTRGIVGTAQDSGASPYHTNILEYVTIAHTGNTIDFGDGQEVGSVWGANSPTRGLWGSVSHSPAKIIYSTISTQGNTKDFGTTSQRPQAGICNAVRAIWAGDYFGNTITYQTIATLGDAADFGDLDVKRDSGRGMSSPTRGLVAGGRHIPSYLVINTISSVEIMTLGNGVDFGDISYMTNTTDFSKDFFGGSNGHGGVC